MKILKNKKSLMSLCTILMAMTIIAGATFAWFTVSGSAGGGQFVSGNLKVEFDFKMPTDHPPEGYQAGDFYESDDLGFVKNTGTLPLFLKINPQVTATLKYELDPAGTVDGNRGLKLVPPYQPANCLVLMGINVPLVDDAGNMINNGYINSVSMLGRLFDIDPITGMITPKDPANIGLLTFHWVLYETPHDPTTPIVGQYFDMVSGAEVNANAVLDWRTNAATIDNTYEDAEFAYSLNLRGTQAAYDDAIYAAFPELVDIDDLDMADDGLITASRAYNPFAGMSASEIRALFIK